MKKTNFRRMCVAAGLLLPSFLFGIEKDGETYLISSASDLVEFSQLVKSGQAGISARLTADIDTRGVDARLVPIGAPGTPFGGTFDGANHSIRIALVSTEDSYGLFPVLNGSGHIMNLYVDGTLEARHNNVGGIVGATFSFASIEQCTSRVDITVSAGQNIGGIVGYSDGNDGPPYVRIENSIYSGHLMGHTGGRCAGIVGYCHYGSGGGAVTVIQNCLVMGRYDVEIPNEDNHIITVVEDTGARISNCYYVYPCGTGDRDGVSPVTMEQVENGEVCHLLNVSAYRWGGIERSTIFRQNIGEDKYPVFDKMHGVVAKIGPEGYATWAGGYFNNWMAECNARVADGVEAFAGTVKGHSLQLHPVEVMNGSNGYGYVIKGEPGFYSFMPTSEAPTDVENDLKGGNGVLDPRYGIYYVLAVKDDVLGFYQVDQSSDACDSHIAYLDSPSFDADVKMISMTFDDATGIAPVLSQGEAEPAVVYDLSGRRVEKMQKGIYVINGKKVLK